MKTRLFVTSIILVLGMFQLNGCKDVPNPPQQSNVPSAINPFTPPGSGSPVAAWMSASVTDNDLWFYTNQSQTGTMTKSSTDFKDLCAAFITDDAQVNPGIVEFDALALYSSPANYFTRYNDLLFSMDGATHVWNVAGSADFPALSDSIVAPTQKVHITSHQVLDYVSKSSSLVVTWNTGGASDEVVMVLVQGKDEQATTVPYFMELCSDNQVCTIPASTFAGFPNQRMTISVSRGRYKTGTASNGKEYLITMYSQHNVDVQLVP